MDYSSNYEHTHTQRNNRTTASHFAPFAESHQVLEDVRRGEPAIFAPPAAAAEGLGDPGHGQEWRGRRRRVARRAASSIWFPVVRLTSFRAQGGGHQPGPREAHRAAQGRAGAAGAGRGRGRQRILRGVPQRGPQVLPAHRPGRERDAREGGDRSRRARGQGANAASYNRANFNLRDSVICGTTERPLHIFASFAGGHHLPQLSLIHI